MANKKKKRPEWFKVHRSTVYQTRNLSNEVVGAAFKAALEVFDENEYDENELMNPFARGLFDMFMGYIREAEYDYKQKIEAGKQSAAAKHKKDEC